MVQKPQGPTPFRKDKTIKRENVQKGTRADTGGDPYDRSQGKYSKAPPKTSSNDPSDRL